MDAQQNTLNYVQNNQIFQLINQENYPELLQILETRLPVSFQMYNGAKYSLFYKETNGLAFYSYKGELGDESIFVATGTIKMKEEDEGITTTFISTKSPEFLTKSIALEIVETFSRGPGLYHGLGFAIDRNTSPNFIQALLNKGYVLTVQSCDMVLHGNKCHDDDNTREIILNNIDQSKYIVKSLNVSDAPKIAKYWTYGLWKHPTHYIEQCIKSYPSVGIYDKETRELLSWVLCYTFGSIGMLHTPEKWRGRGFGTIVMKLIMLENQKVGLYPGTGVEPRNNVSRHLLIDKLGFKKMHSMDFIFTS